MLSALVRDWTSELNSREYHDLPYRWLRCSRLCMRVCLIAGVITAIAAAAGAHGWITASSITTVAVSGIAMIAIGIISVDRTPAEIRRRFLTVTGAIIMIPSVLAIGISSIFISGSWLTFLPALFPLVVAGRILLRELSASLTRVRFFQPASH